MHYDAAIMDLTPGTRIEGWIVEGVLGRGAMATVYAVRHEILDTRAALKVLDRADETLEQRLIREGRAQGSIDHAGIVGVLDHLRVHGHAALLLERVDGGDLRTLLDRGPLPRDVALDLFRQVIEAVAAAHRAGLVHRDLKPSNVLLQRAGERWVVKVSDFGLVKTVDGDLTATHGVVGTPRTMAPEQMRASRRVDARADVFSLGCLLYELVTGSQPFGGDDWVALYAAKDGGHYADPASLVPDLPPEISRAITGCLEGAPARRIPSCDVLLRVLDGEPWSPPSADATLDLQGLLLCPACGAPSAGPDEPACGACGASLALAERYQLVELLAESALTRVWRALDLKDGRWVVARALLPAADATTRQRFERGVSVALQLDHPQIVRPLCPTFEEHGRLWEVRPWIEGRSLAEALEHHRFDAAEVLEVIEGLCEPLRYLAERSPPVVHRAVTPANVVRAADGTLVLLDFAQVRDQVSDASLHDVPEGAPEQWVGEATPATDVYGLGTLAATLLTRRPGRALAHRDRLLGVRDDLRGLLLQMRDADPERRPPIDEVARRARALRLVAPPVRRLRPALFAAAGVVFAFVAVFAAYQSPEPDRPVPAPVAPPSPLRPHQVGADLADRPVPGTDCGATFDARVVLNDTESGPRPLVALSCDGDARVLGTAEPGVPLEVPLAEGERVGIAWGRQWERVKGGEPTQVGILSQPVTLLEEGHLLANVEVTPLRQASWATDDRGMPLLHRPGRLSGDPWLPAAVAERTDAEGRIRLPFPRPLAVQRDGVFQYAFPSVEGALQVRPVRSVRQVRVTDPDDQPIADAEVICLPSRVHARTDAEGRARCGSPEAPHAWAVADAPGRVADVTQLTEGEVRIVLREARRVLVGCHGPAGDSCETLSTPPVCMGSEGRSSGVCRAVGDVFACDCAPDADRIQHGIYGTVGLPADASSVWFDLRDGGTVAGQLEGTTRRCEVVLRTAYGELRTQSDRTGAFRFTGVPEGGYAADARCPERTRLGPVVVTAAAPDVVLQ